MVQKTIWMQLLLIGILSNFIGCDKQVDGQYVQEYYFVNSTDYDIVIEAFSGINMENVKTTFELPKDSCLFQTIEIVFGSRTDIVALSDSVSIKFGTDKILAFSHATQSTHNILDLSNYELYEISKDRVKLTYTFNNSDVENAKEIK